MLIANNYESILTDLDHPESQDCILFTLSCPEPQPNVGEIDLKRKSIDVGNLKFPNKKTEPLLTLTLMTNLSVRLRYNTTLLKGAAY